MASIVQTASTRNDVEGDTVTFGVAPTAGHLLLAWVSRRANSVGLKGGWSYLGAEVTDTSTNSGRWQYGFADGSASYQFLSGSGFSKADITVYDISGADSFTAPDATVYLTDDAASNTVQPLSAVTAPTTGEVILAGWVQRTGLNPDQDATMGSGMVKDYNNGNNDAFADQNPWHLAAHWDGTTTPLTPSCTIPIAAAYGGVVVQITADPPAECDSPLAFDVYSLGDATTPALTYLATVCGAFDKSFRVELDGTGSGQFSINRTSDDATAAILGDGDGDVRFVKVRVPAIDADPIFGFFIEEGDFRLLDEDEEGGETLTFKGHGSLAYLGFATMLAHSYISGGRDPYTGRWRLWTAGTGTKPGQQLRRVIEEAQDPDRPQAPLPLLTIDFDYTNDSNAAAWASSDASAEFEAQIGESVLSVIGRLIGTGAITIQMSPDFLLSAYNSFGTDRSNATFAAGKVRFVGGTNIAEGLTRQIRPSREATHASVYGEAEVSVVSALADAASRVTREVGLTATGTSTTALDAIGDAELAERQLRAESLSVRIALGSDDATGLYLPGPSGSTAGKFWVGDTVTLHTGTGEFDYNNASFPVAAINVIEGPGVVAVTDLEVVVELGSTTIGDAEGGGVSNLLSASPGGGSSAVPAHTHPSSAVISSWKQPVRAASTANITIASPGGTIDGVTMVAQDRVLLPAQTTGSQNGIYAWLGAAVPMVREADFASGASALGSVVYATEGTVNADRAFVCTTNATITIGTTSLTFVPVALLPHGGGEDTVFAHGNMGATETFDPANGNWHTGTFDAACTFTLTAPRTGKGCTLFLELAQNGTGGWAVTLPASFSNKAALEADQVTTASTTAFLLAWTRDGGTTWYGQWVGSGDSPLTTKGDLWGFSTTDARFPVGTNGHLVNADSTAALGVAYISPADVVETAGHWEPLMDGGSPYEPLDDGSGTDWLFVWVP